MDRIPFKPGRESVTGRALLERTTVQIVDAQNDPEYKMSELQKLRRLSQHDRYPAASRGNPIGVFGLARHAVRPFTDKQIELLTTFYPSLPPPPPPPPPPPADQAAIAIENVRLFEAVQQRTREL